MPSIRDVVSGKPASSLLKKKDSKDRVEKAVSQRIKYMKRKLEEDRERVEEEIEISTRVANEAKISSF
jgi:hypothetical protein